MFGIANEYCIILFQENEHLIMNKNILSLDTNT